MLLSQRIVLLSGYTLLFLLSRVVLAAPLATARILASSNSSSTAQCESEGLSGECK